jgi:conjugative transfer region protein TrbK
MDPKIIARAAAVILLAAAVLACALELTRQGRTLESSLPAAHDNIDLLADELARCRALGAEAAHDAACKAVWVQNRARFLAPSPPHQDRSIELFCRDARRAEGDTQDPPRPSAINPAVRRQHARHRS